GPLRRRTRRQTWPPSWRASLRCGDGAVRTAARRAIGMSCSLPRGGRVALGSLRFGEARPSALPGTAVEAIAEDGWPAPRASLRSRYGLGGPLRNERSFHFKAYATKRTSAARALKGGNGHGQDMAARATSGTNTRSMLPAST